MRVKRSQVLVNGAYSTGIPPEFSVDSQTCPCSVCDGSTNGTSWSTIQLCLLGWNFNLSKPYKGRKDYSVTFLWYKTISSPKPWDGWKAEWVGMPSQLQHCLENPGIWSVTVRGNWDKPAGKAKGAAKAASLIPIAIGRRDGKETGSRKEKLIEVSSYVRKSLLLVDELGLCAVFSQ